MGPRLRDADVPQRFEFDDLDLVVNVRAGAPGRGREPRLGVERRRRLGAEGADDDVLRDRQPLLPGQGERRDRDRAPAHQGRRRRQGGARADPDHQAGLRAATASCVEAEYPHLRRALPPRAPTPGGSSAPHAPGSRRPARSLTPARRRHAGDAAPLGRAGLIPLARRRAGRRPPPRRRGSSRGCASAATRSTRSAPPATRGGSPSATSRSCCPRAEGGVPLAQAAQRDGPGAGADRAAS